LGGRYPDLVVRTRQLDPDDAIEAVAMGELDLAFTIDYAHAPAPPRRDVVRETVLEDRFFLIVPSTDPLTGPVASLGETADRSFIASPRTWSCGRCVVAACRNAGFEPDIVHQLDDYPTTLKLVAAGQGVALVPVLGLTQIPDDVRLVSLEPPLSREIQVAYRTASAERPAIQAILQAVFDVIADLDLDQLAA
jgi:DNA-binding transcriptional LysR family regulator